MPTTHQKTVTVSPGDDVYGWTTSGDDNGNWITITNATDSNGLDTDTWDFAVADNGTGATRTATCTVTHSNGSTTDSFIVTQYHTGGVPASTTSSSSTTTAAPYSIVTGAATGIMDSGFTMHGDPAFTGSGTPSTCPRGFMWGTDPNNLTNEIIDTTSSNNNSDPNTFMGGLMAYSYNMTGLQPETTYYYKAFISLGSDICSPDLGSNPGTRVYGDLETVNTLTATLAFTSFFTEVGISSSTIVSGDTVGEVKAGSGAYQKVWFTITATQDIAGYKIPVVGITKIQPNAGLGEIEDFNLANSSILDSSSTSLSGNDVNPFEFGTGSASSNNNARLTIAIAEDNMTEGNETYRLTISPDYTDANDNVLGQHGLSTTIDFIINDDSVYEPTVINNALAGGAFIGPTVTTSNGITLSTYSFDNNPAVQGPVQEVEIDAFGNTDPVLNGGSTNIVNTFYWSNSADGSTNDTGSINGSGNNAVVHNTAVDASHASGQWHAKITWTDGSGSTQATTQGSLS